jgi:hypothetical protein
MVIIFSGGMILKDPSVQRRGTQADEVIGNIVGLALTKSPTNLEEKISAAKMIALDGDKISKEDARKAVEGARVEEISQEDATLNPPYNHVTILAIQATGVTSHVVTWYYLYEYSTGYTHPLTWVGTSSMSFRMPQRCD